MISTSVALPPRVYDEQSFFQQVFFDKWFTRVYHSINFPLQQKLECKRLRLISRFLFQLLVKFSLLVIILFFLNWLFVKIEYCKQIRDFLPYWNLIYIYIYILCYFKGSECCLLLTLRLISRRTKRLHEIVWLLATIGMWLFFFRRGCHNHVDVFWHAKNSKVVTCILTNS